MSNSPLPQLRIYLLGGFRLLLGDAPLTALDTPRQQALLAYLLLQRAAPQPRQRLAYLFWPESSDAQAQTNLRQLLLILRRRLPDAARYLAIDERTVQWRGDAPYSCDMADFEEALARAEKSTGSAALAALEQAATLYTGDLLPELYDDWLLAARERLSQRFVAAMSTLIRLCEERRDVKAAIAHAQRLLRYDPLHEATYRQIMRLHALNGDRPAALRVYHTCATFLDRELGVPPSEATLDAYSRLLKAEPAATHPPSPAQSALTLRLVGRHAEWATLQKAWRMAAAGHAHCVVVAGEAGIGKTRLAEELLTWAAQQGIPSAATRAYAMEGTLPLVPVIDWLRSPAFQPVLASLAPAWRSELARLLPELQPAPPALPASEPSSEQWQRTRLFDALARAVLAQRLPLLLVLDDLQWCDAETLDWLYFLLQFKPDARLLIVATLRPEEVDERHPAVLLRLKLQSAARLTAIDLGALTADETAALAGEVARQTLDRAALDQIIHDTEGNPLFVVETMRMQVEAGAGPGRTTGMPPRSPPLPHLTTALPARIHAMIQARLQRLSPAARELVSLAAVIGRAFTFPVLAQASRGDPDALVSSLDELWQRRIVREQGSGAYDFSHDRIREVAYAEISLARRRLLHRRVAQALEQVYSADLMEISGLLAAHYEHAGLAEQAIGWYWQAVDSARKRFSLRETLADLRKGLALIGILPATTTRWVRELSFSLALGFTLCTIEGPIGLEVRQIFAQAQRLSLQLGQTMQQYEAQRGLWSCYLNRALIAEAGQQAIQNLALAQELQHPRCQRDAHTNMGIACFQVGEFAEAAGHFDRAVAQHIPPESSPVGAWGFELGIEAPFLSASTVYLLGYPEQAQRYVEQALAHADGLQDPYTRAAALYFASNFYQIARDIPALRRIASALVDLATRYDVFSFLFDGSIFLEWSVVLQTGEQMAVERLQQNLANYQQSDNYALTYFFGLAAEAYGVVGHYAEALATIDAALTHADLSGERFWRAELYRLQGDLHQALGEGEVESCYVAALEIARQQHAKILELRAAVSLGKLWQAHGKTNEAQRLVAAVYDWFSEGFEMPDLCSARNFLTQLA